jgi:4-hydroxybenzoyl-CoA thioesterase
VSYRTPYHVRFGDIDGAGIVYYPRLFDYFHQAFEDFWREALSRDYPVVLMEERVGYPAVHIETDFVSPVKYGDRFEIAISVKRIGEKSVTWIYEGYRQSESSAFLRAEVTTACVDMDRFESREVPESHRALLEPHLVAR